MRLHYENTADDDFPGAYSVSGYPGIAWSILGWETEPDEDTEWSGCEVRTGSVVGRMIGDDRHFAIDPSDVERIDDDAYCAECGQIGCCHDGREREAVA
jgi:hypothetical protein